MREETANHREFQARPGGYFRVPDGTLVNPFLNPKDAMSGLPWDLVDGFSLAGGMIPAGHSSEIHVHPYIDQVTVLVAGELDIVMKDYGDDSDPYRIRLSLPEHEPGAPAPMAAVLSKGGDYFQLDNAAGTKDATVLYITTPSYLFEPGAEGSAGPRYDDAIVVGRDWDALRAAGWTHPELLRGDRTYRARRQAESRLRQASERNR